MTAEPEGAAHNRGDLGATGWPGWQDSERVAGHLEQEQGYEPSPDKQLPV